MSEIGAWLLAAAGLVTLVELVLLAWWSVRLGRTAQQFVASLERERAALNSDVAILRGNIAESKRLWEQNRRLLRWLGHPLTIALWESYLRRRRAVG